MNVRNTIVKSMCALSLLVAAQLGPAVASPAPIPHHPRVNQVNARFENQRVRIRQGIENGTLQPCELRKIVHDECRIKKEERAMRAADGGHLTRADQRILNRQLDQTSGEIYRDKHNDY